MKDRCFNLINGLRYSTHNSSKKTLNEMVKLTEPLGTSNEDITHRWLGCLLKSHPFVAGFRSVGFTDCISPGKLRKISLQANSFACTPHISLEITN